MIKKLGFLLWVIVLIPALAGMRRFQPVLASEGTPAPLSSKEEQPILERVSSSAAAATDRYGYTRSAGAGLYSWVDASAKTSVNFSDLDEDVEGPINLGFTFNFYEGQYTQVYLSTNGCLTFQASSPVYKNQVMPSDLRPNAILAPFWDDLLLTPSSRVYYGNGVDVVRGEYFVAEWANVVRFGSSETATLTFEVLLFKNSGDILFNYQNLSDGIATLTEATVGIEDSDGIDGLTFVYNQNYGDLFSGQAVLFERPDPAYRAKALPAYQSEFASRSTADFLIQIKNSGNVASDTFNFSSVAASQPVTANWGMEYYAEDQRTALTDTGDDADTLPNTALLNPGSAVTVTVRLRAPANAVVGNHTVVTVTVSSGHNPANSAQIILRSAIPASFAQVYSLTDGSAQLGLLSSQSQRAAPILHDFSSRTLAVTVNTAGNYVCVWERKKTTGGGIQIIDIEYVVLSQSGSELKSISNLTSNFGATLKTEDDSPWMTPGPNGQTGVVWVRTVYNGAQSQSNVYFAILGPTGAVLRAPAQVTNNNAWKTSGALNIPDYSEARIAAAESNQFLITWVDTREVVTDTLRVDLAGKLYNANTGAFADGPQFTGVAGTTNFSSPSLAALSGNRFLLAYEKTDATSNKLVFYIYSQNGQLLTSDPPPQVVEAHIGSLDVQELTSGALLFVWTDLTYNQAHYALWAGNGSGAISAPKDFLTPNGRPSISISAARDAFGHGIITWLDGTDEYKYLYYSLVSSDGSLATAPMTFYAASGPTSLQTSTMGQGIAAYWLIYSVNLPLIRR